jgi:hypothetical protein
MQNKIRRTHSANDTLSHCTATTRQNVALEMTLGSRACRQKRDRTSFRTAKSITQENLSEIHCFGTAIALNCEQSGRLLYLDPCSGR